MVCKVCSAEFRPKRPWQQFCRNKCRMAHHTAVRAAAMRQYQQKIGEGGNGGR